ncbi:hypothetical protein JKP88DRAFT_268608 [Tribonema minus]|uniref:Tafazzin family protein n=1 Tax=Tribonema minus TaxID=303371 RepID=A0A835Z8H0_9STRA|nr:hypothetical protein JKP88DRAFT_268608 [Tribonema minus]
MVAERMGPARVAMLVVVLSVCSIIVHVQGFTAGTLAHRASFLPHRGSPTAASSAACDARQAFAAALRGRTTRAIVAASAGAGDVAGDGESAGGDSAKAKRRRWTTRRRGGNTKRSSPAPDTGVAADGTSGSTRTGPVGVLKAIGKRVGSFWAVGIVGILFRIMLQVLNRVRVTNLSGLIRHVDHRTEGTPLLTVSNHMSVLDDPGLWGAILPFWRLGPRKMRWSLCTDDVYFAVKPLVPFYRQGQPILGDFKAGVGRLVARCSSTPVIVPMYHIGMHTIAPEQPVPRRAAAKLQRAFSVGRQVRMYVGEPVEVEHILNKWKQGWDGQEGIGDVSKFPWSERGTLAELACHEEITAAIRDAVLELEKVARRDYYGDDSLVY